MRITHIDSRLVSALSLAKSEIRTSRDIAQRASKRIQVARILNELDATYWEEFYPYLAADPSWRVREQVAFSIGASGYSAAIPCLGKLASDGVWRVRYCLILSCEGLRKLCFLAQYMTSS